MNRVVQDPGYTGLKDRVIDLTGLAFYANRDELLTEVISGRLSALGLGNCSSYMEWLDDGNKNIAEIDVLVARLTIGETSFFRDEGVFTAIREVILPSILDRNRTSKQIRIWSAGCATGAEPYSLAIMLMDEFAGRIAGWRIAIHATDLNRGFLAQAEKGEFRAWALHSTSDKVKRECFSNKGLVWTIHPRYKAWTSFHYMNLVESVFSTAWAGSVPFDLILCRNVMIYFAPSVNRRLIGQLQHSLNDDGWLVVGSSEHSLEGYQSFRTVNAPGAKLYQKAAAETQNIEVVKPEVLAQPLRGVVAERRPSDAGQDDVKRLRQLLDRGNWQLAARYGEGLVNRDRLNPEIHFYQALIFEKLGIADQAERSLRQAIYLDRNFALAHYHLGLALKRDGHVHASARSFGNVLRVLAATPDDATITAGPGVTATGLRELAKMHLQDSSAA